MKAAVFEMDGNFAKDGGVTIDVKPSSENNTVLMINVRKLVFLL